MKEQAEKAEKLNNDDSTNILKELTSEKKEGEGESDEEIPSQLPKWVKFPPCEDEFYPAEFNGVVYDCYGLRVVFDWEKTGFEESREF